MNRRARSRTGSTVAIPRAALTAALWAAVLTAAALIFTVHAARAQDPGSRAVDGLTVYFGVMPGEIVKGHPKSHAERSMHGGTSGDEHSYHLVVAVFDAVTGTRITDATVKAKVQPPSRPSSTISLEKMEVAGTTTYGNFFPIAGYGTYRFAIEVYRHNETRPAVAEFTYDHRLK